MSKYVLMHGTFVEVSDDELKHWKYIKREKKNGKWVYYYDTATADRDALSGVRAANENLAKAERASKEANDALNYRSPSDLIDYDKKLIAADKADKNLAAAKRRAEKAVKKYESMKIGRSAQRAINNGLIKVMNLFSGLFSKKKK